MSIPDTNEIVKTGLTDAKPYLGSPSVVEDVLREYLADLQGYRADQVQNSTDPLPRISERAAKLQDVFYGRTDRFIVSAWHRESSLGKALVEGAGIGGDTSDAVLRVGTRIARDFYQDLIAYEEDRMDDKSMQDEINKLVQLYVTVLMGGREERWEE